MVLVEIEITNFGCFEQFRLDGLNHLNFLVGENDSGKTVLLNSIELLLSPRSVVDDDFYRQGVEGRQADSFCLMGMFKLQNSDNELPDEFRTGPTRDRLCLKRKFYRHEKNHECLIRGWGFEDSRLEQFHNLKANEQKEVLKSLEISPESNKEKREKQLEELEETGRIQRAEKDLEVPFSKMSEYLPSIQRISARDFTAPDQFVLKTLRDVARTTLESETMDTSLKGIEAFLKESLGEKLREAEKFVKRFHPRIKNVGIEPSLDFAHALKEASILVDSGFGDRALESCGDGTQRRVWMGLLEWEHRTREELTREHAIRLYDEPDASLHFDAQRHQFRNIASLARDESRRFQCFVATHSVAMIDLAPARSLCLIRVNADDSREVERISGADVDSADVDQLLSAIGRQIGLTNVALLTEKGFLVFEGQSEQEALPILYRKLHGKSLAEDGLRMINLRGAGSATEIIRILLENRLEVVHLVFDSDTKGSQTYRMAKKQFEKRGLDPHEYITSVGKSEFEDCFNLNVIVKAFNDSFPRRDKREWEPEDIGPAEEEGKFSQALARLIRRETMESQVGKPKIAAALADACTREEVPKAIEQAFRKLRSQASIEQSEEVYQKRRNAHGASSGSLF